MFACLRILVEFHFDLVLVEEEGRGVGREDGRVEDEQQDDPVPDGLEGRVVQDDELGAGALQLAHRLRLHGAVLVRLVLVALNLGVLLQQTNVH